MTGKQTPNAITATMPLLGPMSLRVTLTPQIDELEKLRQRLEDPAPMWQAIGEYVRAVFRSHFDRGGVPPWKPLAKATIRRKQALARIGKTKDNRTVVGNENTPLVLTGELRKAWTESGAFGSISEFSKGRGFFGAELTRDVTSAPRRRKKRKKGQTSPPRSQTTTSVALAAVHEMGQGQIPARPVGNLEQTDVEQIARIVRRWLIEGVTQ